MSNFGYDFDCIIFLSGRTDIICISWIAINHRPILRILNTYYQTLIVTIIYNNPSTYYLTSFLITYFYHFIYVFINSKQISIIFFLSLISLDKKNSNYLIKFSLNISKSIFMLFYCNFKQPKIILLPSLK